MCVRGGGEGISFACKIFLHLLCVLPAMNLNTVQYNGNWGLGSVLSAGEDFIRLVVGKAVSC
jgi:hypothetical protein